MPPAPRKRTQTKTVALTKTTPLPPQVQDLTNDKIAALAKSPIALSVDLPLSTFTVLWEYLERKTRAVSSMAADGEPSPVVAALLEAVALFRASHELHEGATTASQQRLDSVGSRKVPARRVPPKRR